MKSGSLRRRDRFKKRTFKEGKGSAGLLPLMTDHLWRSVDEETGRNAGDEKQRLYAVLWQDCSAQNTAYNHAMGLWKLSPCFGEPSTEAAPSGSDDESHKLMGVLFVSDTSYMCTTPTKQMLKVKIKTNKLQSKTIHNTISKPQQQLHKNIEQEWHQKWQKNTS